MKASLNKSPSRFLGHVRRHAGASLVELLVAIAMMAALAAMILPAIQAAREAARRATCQNNLRQLAVGVLNYEAAVGHLPPSTVVDLEAAAPDNVSWGVHGRILDYLQQRELHRLVDLEVAWDFQRAISGVRIALFQCPSDDRAQEVRDPGGGKSLLYSTNYGFNFGAWFVFEPYEPMGGDGVFFPNSDLPLSSLVDGTARTLLCAEVKSWQPYTRTGSPLVTISPSTPAEAAAVVARGGEFKATGHTVWPDGRVHHTGFTAALTPNAFVPYEVAGVTTDADFNSWLEGNDGRNGHPTYAVVTSRSCHPDLVQAALVGGSVQTISNAIDLLVWRALATRSGAEDAVYSY
jgi:type II secretory pathway pseudopilin PulG